MPGESLLGPRGRVTPSPARVHLQTSASKARLPPRTAASPRPPVNHVGTCPGTRRLKLFHGNVPNKQREEPGAPRGGGMGRAGRPCGWGRARAVPRLQLWAEARPAHREAVGPPFGGPGRGWRSGEGEAPITSQQTPTAGRKWQRHGGLEEASQSLRKTQGVSCSVVDPMDCSPAGSSVHRILQARILEWAAIPSSRGSSQPRDQTQVSCIVGGFFTI